MHKPVTPLNAWLQAARLRTLPLAVACVLLGAGLACGQGYFNAALAVLTLTTTLLLQVLANLANDYGDTLHGADNALRVGPRRAVQQGWLTPKAMALGIVLCALLTLLSGAGLLLMAWPRVLQGGLALWVLAGVFAPVLALGYTLGPKPYGYVGLGGCGGLRLFWLTGHPRCVCPTNAG